MAKISILIVLLPHLWTILCNETSNNVGSNQSLETNQLNNDNECDTSDHSPFALQNDEAIAEWPWVVALFTTDNESGRNTFEFRCSGTLLTNRHVLTVAHCVKTSSNTTIHPSQITVTLGRFNMSQWHENEVINREIEKIEIHPDYTHESSADSDLAILTLKRPVEFSPSVRPICMWSGSDNLEDVVGRQGYVVGRGMRGVLSEARKRPLLEEPQAARVLIVSQGTCLRSNRVLFHMTSDHTFCASLQDDSSCIEDSGSGLVLLDNTTNRYQLRGVVSRAVFSSDSSSCDHRNYVVYIDVAKYIPWIQQHISTA